MCTRIDVNDTRDLIEKMNMNGSVDAEYYYTGTRYSHKTVPLIKLLNIGSIRIYILMTGVVSNETNTYVRMYIEEFILVDLDTLLHKVEVLNE